MGIIAEQWLLDEGVQLSVQRAVGAARLTGLVRRELPGECEALLLPRCRSVHTFGLRQPIDVVFLDRHNRVCSIERVAPRRLAQSRHASAVLELRDGEAARLGIVPGSRFSSLAGSNGVDHAA